MKIGKKKFIFMKIKIVIIKNLTIFFTYILYCDLSLF